MPAADPVHRAAARLALRLAPPLPFPAQTWSPPTMLALKARIDAALAERGR